jgi:serine/threonine-protein kinase ATR
VHVDFDCLFDKGLSLARPEIVPFRLTPNMVDAMGLTGVEGTYRRSMEVCMNLLRENKSVLLSVVEPFIRDPTVSWGRSGRAQRNNDVDMSGAKQVAIHDVENKDAEQALRKISQRLSGVYNIINPNAKLIVATYHANKAAPSSTSMGLGAYQEEELPLSVTGQVQRLIEEATAEINLAQMYIGRVYSYLCTIMLNVFIA